MATEDRLLAEVTAARLTHSETLQSQSIFSRFIEQNRDKKPYIFALIVREWMSFNYFECYHLDANGNTAVDFESQGMGSLAELNSRLGEWVAKREADRIPLDKETKRLRKSDRDRKSVV